MLLRSISPELIDRVEVVVEAGAAEQTVTPKREGMNGPAWHTRPAVLLKAEEIRLKGDDVRPCAPVSDCSIEPLPIFRFVDLVFETLQRLYGEEIQLPIVGLLSECETEALEIVGRVAPLVICDQPAIHKLEGHPARTDAQRALIPERIKTQGVPEIQFRIGLDEFELVHIAVIPRVVAAISPRILALQGKTEWVAN